MLQSSKPPDQVSSPGYGWLLPEVEGQVNGGPPPRSAACGVRGTVQTAIPDPSLVPAAVFDPATTVDWHLRLRQSSVLNSLTIKPGQLVYHSVLHLVLSC